MKDSSEVAFLIAKCRKAPINQPDWFLVYRLAGKFVRKYEKGEAPVPRLSEQTLREEQRTISDIMFFSEISYGDPGSIDQQGLDKLLRLAGMQEVKESIEAERRRLNRVLSCKRRCVYIQSDLAAVFLRLAKIARLVGLLIFIRQALAICTKYFLFRLLLLQFLMAWQDVLAQGPPLKPIETAPQLLPNAPGLAA